MYLQTKHIALCPLPIANCLLPIAFCLLTIGIQAQGKKARAGKSGDSLAIIQQVLQVSKLYQQLPLHLEIDITNTTNFITGEEDTTGMHAVFTITPGASYIHFGEMEQLVNDSMALMVNSKLQRMILYSQAKAILNQMRTMTGLPWQNATVQQIANRFRVQAEALANNVMVVVLNARNGLHGTSVPEQTLELQYDAITNMPVKVIATTRSWIALEETDYKTLSSQGNMNGNLVAADNNRYGLVKEQATTFVYKKISHEEGLRVPATIADRIGRNENGEFVPVKQFAQYALTIR